MRKKLRPAEERVLKCFGDDFDIGDGRVLPAELRPYNIPTDKKQKANCNTIANLYKMRIVKHGHLDLYACPMRLTKKGREVLNKLKDR